MSSRRHPHLSPPPSSPKLLYILVLALGLNAILSFLLIFHPSFEESHTTTIHNYYSSLRTTHHHIHLHGNFTRKNQYDDKVSSRGVKTQQHAYKHHQSKRRMSETTRIFYMLDNSYNQMIEANESTNFESLLQDIDDAGHHNENDSAEIPSNTTPQKQQQQTTSNCTPMATWQTTSYPACNSIHELNIFSSSQNVGYFQPNIIRDKEEQRGRLPFHMIYQQQQKGVESDSYITKLSRILEHRRLQKKMNEIPISDSYSTKILGNGWFRHAWEVVDNVLGTRVAIKTLRPERDFIPEYYGK